jgi:lysophospholipase L1-like esterase
MPRLASLAACAAAVGLGLTASILPAASASADVSSYASLGDSYTAGLGVPNNVGTPSSCGRSDHNYPTLVAAGTGAASFTDASCSGATTVDMANPQTTQDGTNPPQFSALSDSTSLVTVSIGANDVNVIGFIEKCMSLSLGNLFGAPCRNFYASGGTDQFAQAVADTAPKVAAVIQQIHQLAPNATVYFVGYPVLIPNSGFGCYFTVPVSAGDVPWLRSEWIAMDQMLANVAAANGATFVDTYTPSIGHDYCQPAGVAWVQGVVQRGGWPLHPNALGEQALASDVLAAVNS